MMRMLVFRTTPSRRVPFVVCGIGLAVAVAVALALVWDGRHSEAPAPVGVAAAPSTDDVSLRAGSTMAPADAAHLTFRTGLEALPASLQGTEVSGELETDGHGNLKVTRGLRLLFDYFLSASGEEPAARQRERVRAYITHRMRNPAAREQAWALLDTYLAYKDELLRTLSHSRATSLSEMQARLGTVTALRARHFQPEVVAAFFGDDQAYDRYTLAKLAILNDTAGSAAQKAVRIAELRNAEPEEVRRQMDVGETVQTLDALTTSWQQRAGSPQELRELRETLVGSDAADRLESLDRQTQAWDSRVATYLHQRARVLGDATLADSMRQQQIEALRRGAFAENESIRIEAIERIQDSAARDAAATVPRSHAPG